MPNETHFSIDQVRRYITDIPMARTINMIGIHHTWEPTAADYKGLVTIQGIRRYHMIIRKFIDNGYNWLVAPNGDIWRCRPMNIIPAHIAGHNSHSVGVGFIANFDVEDPAAYGGMKNGLALVRMILKRFNLSAEAIHFHREYASKSCPGGKLKLMDFRNWVMGPSVPTQDMLVIWAPTGEVVDCGAVLEGEVTVVNRDQFCQRLGCGIALATTRTDGRVPLRQQAHACGLEVIWHPEQPNKVYLRPALP